MARTKPADQQDAQGSLIKARVLVECHLGKCNDVVEIDENEVEGIKDLVDTTPEAVAYAESLQKE